ncbi:RDD family protein [Mycolicibacterium gadium]|uniref:RDD family protein n=1 Tax=Mycolicibacterium gadium TaxID=1794 RepID=A0ABT6GYB5_MYCGU|nr:RDD family protein [Mycolicibacterium gadium]MDG5486167.1 RDD family protein [Mycolicibacterium gadium]
MRANVTSQPPPPPAGDFAQGVPSIAPVVTGSDYTPWFTRVLAYVIDSIPVYLLTAIGGVVLYIFQPTETLCVAEAFCATGRNGPSTTAWIIFSLCVLVAVAFTLWNFVVRQGNTGSSIGKQIMDFKVVDEQTQQPIGVGKSLLRQIAHGIDALICYIGFLFPLWDAKRQTIADKLLKTVCVPL